jgi:hypothetical protein
MSQVVVVATITARRRSTGSSRNRVMIERIKTR